MLSGHEAAIARVLAGDVDAFADVVDSYHLAVRNYVAGTFPYPDRIDDLTQEIFIRIFYQLPRYRSEFPFWPWLRGVARNVIREELRAGARLARDRRAFAEATLLKEADRRLGREDEDHEKVLRVLRACIEKLAPRARQIVRWFYEDGRTTDAMAEEMNCGGSAVRNNLVRIRRNLEACIRRQTEVARG